MEKAGKRCTVKFKFKFIFIFLLIEVEFALMPIHSYWKYENAEKCFYDFTTKWELTRFIAKYVVAYDFKAKLSFYEFTNL